MNFRLYNVDHELTVEQLGEILHLPLYGLGAAPDSFNAKKNWLAVMGRTDYVVNGAKASGIHNDVSAMLRRYWLSHSSVGVIVPVRLPRESYSFCFPWQTGLL